MKTNKKKRRAALAESGDPSVVSSIGQDINYKIDSNSRNISPSKRQNFKTFYQFYLINIGIYLYLTNAGQLTNFYL